MLERQLLRAHTVLEAGISRTGTPGSSLALPFTLSSAIHKPGEPIFYENRLKQFHKCARDVCLREKYELYGKETMNSPFLKKDRRTFSLEGHVALVTGATTGLGKNIAMTLGKGRAKVAINYYNNQRELSRFSQSLRKPDTKVFWFVEMLLTANQLRI